MSSLQWYRVWGDRGCLRYLYLSIRSMFVLWLAGCVLKYSVVVFCVVSQFFVQAIIYYYCWYCGSWWINLLLWMLFDSGVLVLYNGFYDGLFNFNTNLKLITLRIRNITLHSLVSLHLIHLSTKPMNYLKLIHKKIPRLYNLLAKTVQQNSHTLFMVKNYCQKLWCFVVHFHIFNGEGH